MRVPRFRLRTLMALVAAIALVIGGAIEARNYRECARYARFERQFLVIADRFDRTAEMQRKGGDLRSAKESVSMGSDCRDHSKVCAQERRRLERGWYRYLGD
jgi:hypothetical protein